MYRPIDTRPSGKRLVSCGVIGSISTTAPVRFEPTPLNGLLVVIDIIISCLNWVDYTKNWLKNIQLLC
jgi:hypothetical protein